MSFKELHSILLDRFKSIFQKKATSNNQSVEIPLIIKKKSKTFTVVGETHIGLVRESNQDRFLIDVDNGIFIVADGMGGHSAGEVASQMAVEHVSEYIKEWLSNNSKYLRHIGTAANDDLQTALEQAFTKANNAVYSAWQGKSELAKMGTTLITAWIIDNKCVLGHVGDVRGYLLRDGHLKQLTRDHTRVAQMVESGQITPEEARHHPLRNRIQRSIGPHPHVSPDISFLDLKNKDRILLCSDGLWGMVTDSQIASALTDQNDIRKACENLVDYALAGGGEDNITVSIMEVI